MPKKPKTAAAKKAAAAKAAAAKAATEKEQSKFGAVAEMTDSIWNNLDEAFVQKKDEINAWKPEEAGESVFGQVIEFAVSTKHKTPYLVVMEPEGTDIIVFVKSGLVSQFERKRWLTPEGTWDEEAYVNNDGCLIAVRYEGDVENPATGRTFQSYKVLFQDELPASALKVFGVE